jgi:hypothetical protein
MSWIILILCSFAFGFYNISLAVNDYYKFDVITNVVRVEPKVVTYPAITICIWDFYIRDHFVNGSLIERGYGKGSGDNLRIRNFIDFKEMKLMIQNITTATKRNVSDHNLDFFKIFNRAYDCFRVNGVTNKSVELFKANSTSDFLTIRINSYYIKNVTENEYFNFSVYDPFYKVYIVDNSLNSFLKLQPLVLESDKFHKIEIAKESIEIKLPQPYNPCKESSAGSPYHKWNCIESCIFREIQIKKNCTFPFGLYSIHGLNKCNNGFSFFFNEFYDMCLNECPESCFSKKFNHYITTRNGSGNKRLNFVLRDLSSLMITQIPKTDAFTFVNNIGGGLGLFMGIALPHFIELIQFILEIVLIIFIRKN